MGTAQFAHRSQSDSLHVWYHRYGALSVHFPQKLIAIWLSLSYILTGEESSQKLVYRYLHQRFFLHFENTIFVAIFIS